jgi:FtsP/CotA-like multicopper oxidase with cupredoxin domain
MMNYYSALDRGKEDFNDGVNLRFPSGTALPWGNRDYDVNLMIADKAWDRDGQLWFNIFNTDGFLGDQVMVNWLWRPYLDVRARRYRFRILNGSVSRYISLALVRQVDGNGGEMPGPRGSGVSYDRVPFHMIANDGNIMEHAVPFDGTMDLNGEDGSDEHKGQLPTQGIAERYDIIVDFSRHGILPGDKLYFVNTLEHSDGKGVKDRIPLKEILSEEYLPVIKADSDGRSRWENGDPGVAKILELRVHAYAGTDLSMDPRNYLPANGSTPAGRTMIPLTVHFDNAADLAKLANARHRTFKFVRGGTDDAPWAIKTDEGSEFNMDSRRISAAPQLANGPTQAGYAAEVPYEVWTIDGGGGWDHPVHIHFEEGIILSRGGKAPPEWEKWARKDVYRIGPSPDSKIPVKLAIRFREFAGTYMEHCHNTQHEDHAMLLRWDIEHPGQFTLMPAPLPTWDGVEYVDSVALPTYRTVLLSESPAGDKAPGATVTFTATVIGVSGPLEYEFQARALPDGPWEVTQPYSSTGNYVLNTTGLPAGDFEVKVNVRNAGTTSTVGMATLPTTLTSSAF